jgi:hypothetical protein
LCERAGRDWEDALSSIFGHRLAAIYQDRAFAFRPRAPWLAIGAAFVVGAVCAITAMKVSGSSDRPAQATASQIAPKPGSPMSAQVAAGRTEPAAKPVRVIAPDVVPPPPNVTAAAAREAGAERPKPAIIANTPDAATADTNVGAAPRETIAEPGPADNVPMPPPKPAELRMASAPEAAPAGVGDAPRAPSAATAPAPAAGAAPPSVQPEAVEPTAKPTRREARQGRAARREVRRLQREEARRLAQDRSHALHERNAADGFSLVDAYRTRDGRRVTVYRRYDDDRSAGAVAYGEDRSRRGFFGLFDFD